MPGHKCKGQVFSLEVVVYPNDVLLETEQGRADTVEEYDTVDTGEIVEYSPSNIIACYYMY